MRNFKNLFVVLLGGVVCASAQQGPPPAQVVVAPVVEESVAQRIELVGTIEARRRSVVAAQIGGAVVEVNCEEGDRVKAGDALIRLDDTPLKIAHDAAVAARAGTDAQHREQVAALKRTDELFKKGRVAEAVFDADRHAEEALRQRLAEHDAEIRRTADALSKASVVAPFDGTVAHRHTELGEWVGVGGAVVDLLQLDPVDVVLDLPERYGAAVDLEAAVDLTTDAEPGVSYSGTIQALIPDADPQAHTLPLKVRVANPEGHLHAGMFARASVPLKEQEALLLVPKDAIVPQGAMNMVFLVVDGAASQVVVQRGLDYEDRVAISGPVKAGDRVVVRGNERIFPNQPLQITETLD